MREEEGGGNVLSSMRHTQTILHAYAYLPYFMNMRLTYITHTPICTNFPSTHPISSTSSPQHTYTHTQPYNHNAAEFVPGGGGQGNFNMPAPVIINPQSGQPMYFDPFKGAYMQQPYNPNMQVRLCAYMCVWLSSPHPHPTI